MLNVKKQVENKKGKKVILCKHTHQRNYIGSGPKSIKEIEITNRKQQVQMCSGVNSTKYVRKELCQFSKISFREQKQREYF